MNSNIVSEALSAVQKFGIILLVLATLFLFANFTTEFYDTPKFLSLMVFLTVLLLLSALKHLSEGRVLLKLTPLDLPLLVLLVVTIISTVMSSSISTSIGNLPAVNGSLAGFGALILLYFLLVQNLKQNDYSSIINVLLGSGIVLSIISLLSYLGVKLLLFSWTQGLNFTPTGSSFSTTAVLVLLLPFLLNNILFAGNSDRVGMSYLNKIISALTLTLFGVTIALTGVWATYIGAVVAVLLTLSLNKSSAARRFYPYVIGPILVVAAVAVVSFLPGLKNEQSSRLSTNTIYTQAQNFPREITLPFLPSWKIAASSFRDSPFWGSGPATVLSDFTSYKPLEINNTNLWNIRFGSLFNEYLNILATLGGLGFLVVTILTLQYFKSAWTNTLGKYGAVALSGLLFFLMLALHPATLVFWIIGLIILVLFYIVNDNLTTSLHLKLGTGSSEASNHLSLDLFPLLLFLIILGMVGVAEFFTGKYLLADYYHRQALNSVAANNGRAAYDRLVKAENLNPYHDLYRTDLAQTNFALANAIAAAKGPTESSPAGSLNDTDKQTIQQLLQQAIAEGRAATALNPKNAANWEVLGSIYRQIAGVAQNALQFALDSYGRAIQLDPLNPILRLNVGGIYYSIKNYDLAIRFFSDSINLKPDYGNAYYNLSVALRDKGDLKNAQAIAERLISLVDQKSPDYKVASDYLSDLKARIATGSAGQSAIGAPAAQTNSSLQKPGEPILNLPKPENIATPPAVKK